MRILYFISIALLLHSCHSNVQNREQLKQKYSAEVINYFYETAFFQENVGKRDLINKWTKDIHIYMTGENTPNDIDHVKKAIAQLASLQLPIGIHITPDSSKANMFIYFGDYPYLEKMGLGDSIERKCYYGKFVITNSAFNTNIKSAKVGIVNNSEMKRANETDEIKYRQGTILEEITQSLGITSDSWLYPNSRFFEGNKMTQGFIDIDKEILQFLYEPSIPSRYSRKQFEKDFGDVLHHINAPQKIADYVLAYNIPLHYLEYIRERCFFDGILVKWLTEIPVRLKGVVSTEDTAFYKHVVNHFNSVSNQFNLTLSDYRFIGIDISNIHKDTMEYSVQYKTTMYIDTMMFPRLRLYDVNITSQQEKNKAIFDILYELLLGIHNSDVNHNVMEVDSLGNMLLKPDYKNILALIYEPVFYSGLTIGELDEAIDILKTKGYGNKK